MPFESPDPLAAALPVLAPERVTGWLQRWAQGDPSALEPALEALYQELRRIARRFLKRERGTTLEPTALVHEVYLRLRELSGVEWESREHFLAFSACLMRRFLIRQARDRRAAKRGGQAQRITLSGLAELGFDKPADLLALDDALRELGRLDARKAAVVELRFFGGMTATEIAEVLEISEETIGREWRRARAWLLAFLDHSGGVDES
ncbi:MAG TPA: ECF-type sigma factor [Thermoanaerobaculia bacterium]|nr:ECF-type sigma factor [Thermoanaerobaculia bacterium]